MLLVKALVLLAAWLLLGVLYFLTLITMFRSAIMRVLTDPDRNAKMSARFLARCPESISAFSVFFLGFWPISFTLWIQCILAEDRD